MTNETKRLCHTIECILFEKDKKLFTEFSKLVDNVVSLESTLTRGGLIVDQDKNICKAGDLVVVTSYKQFKVQKLVWNASEKSFWLKESCGYTRRLMDLPFRKATDQEIKDFGF